MRFRPTGIAGVVVVELEPIHDERGFFARAWCAEEFSEHGIEATFVQENVASNPRPGTLRGLHFQHAPYEEAKLVRCTRGAIFDVALDVRAGSPTFRQWVGEPLSAENGRLLYIPEGCAHGYLTLEADTEVRYLTTFRYVPEAADGVNFADPAFGIAWPAEITLVSERDASWPLLGGGTGGAR
jgi:dTDP-4-dehydrorhamnose 3,5-epimerase